MSSSKTRTTALICLSSPTSSKKGCAAQQSNETGTQFFDRIQDTYLALQHYDLTMEQVFVLVFIHGLQNSNLETEVRKQKPEKAKTLGAMKRELTVTVSLHPAYNAAVSSTENVAAAFVAGNSSLLHGIQGTAYYSRPRNVFKPRGRGNFHRQQPRQQNFARICYRCHQESHTARFCQTPWNDVKANSANIAASGASSQNEGPNDKHSENEISFMVQALSANSAAASVIMSKWIIDSGASCHITHDRSILKNYRECNEYLQTYNSQAQIIGIGDVELKVKDANGSSYSVMLREVKHVPTGHCNLLSVRAAMKNGGVFSFESDKVWLHYENEKKLFGVSPEGDSELMIVNGNALRENVNVNEKMNLSVNLNDREMWHQRLGHLGEKMLSKTMGYYSECKLDFDKVLV
ncbi:hypothetical protein TRICI_003706 [Trichomonascus ciferrii]|uniref:Retrovirus-related Pol polyprotein from transposon TNT 1-94-like beta-barrel domain-containing protein n=1 Tax=Trichomonascus ciferrii TaxID=44093 RepID=A0A642V321_9ASCO|nr:hypothetical protein TRICI_003706 [Trichomonascus ciferrii]